MRIVTLVIASLILIVAGGILTVAFSKVRAAADKIKCANNLKQIGLAIHNYHDTYGRFPPAAKRNPNLSVEHRLSWLYSVLPFVMSSPFFGQFDPDKAWDSEENRLGAVTLEWYPILQCPSYPDRPPTSKYLPTHYLGIAGLGKDAAQLPLEDPNAGVFGYERKLSFEDIKDDRATTMMVMETAWASGAWTAGGPDTVRGLDPEGSPYLGVPWQFGGNHPGGANILFVDGSVHFLPSSTDPRILEAMATVAGGEDLSQFNWEGF